MLDRLGCEPSAINFVHNSWQVWSLTDNRRRELCLSQVEERELTDAFSLQALAWPAMLRRGGMAVKSSSQSELVCYLWPTHRRNGTAVRYCLLVEVAAHALLDGVGDLAVSAFRCFEVSQRRVGRRVTHARHDLAQ